MITKRIVWALMMLGMIVIPTTAVQAQAEAFESSGAKKKHRTIKLDVACDCRMGSAAFFGGNRGDAWIVSGKIFPAGTLPTGTATNDPTLPVGGVAPIGEWTCRGQNALPFPPAVGAAYDASPFGFNTQYFILNDGRALTLEGYALPGFTGERLSLTGGIGGFSGAGGDVEEGPLGTNATGCPNFRAKFTIRPGSVH